MLRKRSDMNHAVIGGCHNGVGELDFHEVLTDGDSDVGIAFMHDDILEPNATIGEHPHEGMEELYFCVSGSGSMILDGEGHPFEPGDVSLCKHGHSHGLRNGPDAPMRLIVVAVTK